MELRRFTVRDGRKSDHTVAVREYGDSNGEPFVMLHSLGLDGSSFSLLVNALSQIVPVRVFAPDLRGHGGSGAPAEDISLLGMSEDVVAFAGQQGSRRMHLLGLSMGSVVARYAAARDPGLWKSVTLIAGPPVATPAIATRGDAALRGGMGAVIDETLTRWFSSEALRLDISGVKLARKALLRMDPRSWAASWAAMSRFETPSALPEGLPGLCIGGSEDRSTPPAQIERLRDVAEISGPAVIVDTGPHQLALECPQAIAKILAQHWLD